MSATALFLLAAAFAQPVVQSSLPSPLDANLQLREKLEDIRGKIELLHRSREDGKSLKRRENVKMSVRDAAGSVKKVGAARLTKDDVSQVTEQTDGYEEICATLAFEGNMKPHIVNAFVGKKTRQVILDVTVPLNSIPEGIKEPVLVIASNSLVGDVDITVQGVMNEVVGESDADTDKDRITFEDVVFIAPSEELIKNPPPTGVAFLTVNFTAETVSTAQVGFFLSTETCKLPVELADSVLIGDAIVV
ncbi:unnamed protein product [Vitrella brassicaformis CCMP3155]|uniref:Uncharacterized protein n=2 Tax=Vitrella brassicaformis TaxID=1169539 RepID=A0A0G4EHY9_VITBC|nr:unnamed protein product [Vitrella brassicaformis CCMP3155]|eukprot:CEL95575.1 unnamed protein product [Vitrella brassicaformis CCMP3155]